MSEAGPTTAELQRSPETASMQETTLHLRLVHGGEALNPDATDLTPPTAEQIEQADNTDVNTCIRNASTAECATHYNDTENQELERRSRTATGTEQQQIHNEKVQRYERHLQNWLTETTERAQAEYNPDTPEGQRRLGVLQQLGLLNQGEPFTQETAQRLYNRFCFAQDGTNLMDQFIDTIVRTHSLEEIQQNIPDIRWLAHAGGSMNADVVVHTALARKQAQHAEQRQYLTHKAAETTTVNNTAVSNYNIVTPEARRILSHLYKHRPQEAQQQPQEQTPPNEPPVDPSGRRQEQDDDTRATPDLAPEINRLPPGFRRENRIRMPDHMYSSIKDIENFILSPEIMAQRLHYEQPDLFAGQTPQETTQQIQNERDTLRQELRDLGFDASNLTEAVKTYTNQYREFLHTKYGIDLPSFPVHVYPYEGPTTSHLFEDSKHALGFVKPHQPVIYLNMKKIKNQTPDILGVNTPWDQLPNQQKKYVLDRLMSEIIPHELTHLMGTVRHSIVSNDQTNDMMVSARVFGTEVGKEMFPRKPDGSNDFDVLYRGGGLSEAITVELTDQWATNINGELDIPAYTNERKVLHALCNVIAQEQGISRNEAFAYFARAYFDTKDLGTLSRFLVGKTEDKPGIAYHKRPHFLQEVSFLMRYEKQKADELNAQQQQNGNPEYQHPTYDLTLNYIQGRLSTEQRQELTRLLNSSTPLFLTPEAQEHLLRTIGVDMQTQQQAKHHEPVITVDTSTIRNAQNPQEALLHAVDAENNRAAAQHFIRQLDALKQNAQPVDNPGSQRQMYRNELGIEFDQGGWYNANLFLQYMKDRYNLPLALYISGGGFDAQGKRTAGVHANLITRIYQDGSDWKIEYWDPYRTGDSGRTLEDPSIRTATVSREDADSLLQNSIKFGDAQGLEALRVLNTNGIVASMDIGTVLTGGENSYNLSFSGEEVEVANTKEASLQPHQDAQNCVAYCMFNGLMRTAAKYDSHNPPPHLKDFFETGLTQFEQDWGIHVLKRDEIDRLQQHRAAA